MALRVTEHIGARRKPSGSHGERGGHFDDREIERDASEMSPQ